MSKFKVGDKVVATKTNSWVGAGEEFTVTGFEGEDFKCIEHNGISYWVFEVTDIEHVPTDNVVIESVTMEEALEMVAEVPEETVEVPVETVEVPFTNEVIETTVQPVSTVSPIAELTNSIAQWHMDRQLIENSTDQAQFVKLIEECGELAGGIARGEDLRDHIGDVVVVLINIAYRNGYNLQQCMQVAYDDIKNRTGHMSAEGVFIKDGE